MPEYLPPVTFADEVALVHGLKGHFATATNLMKQWGVSQVSLEVTILDPEPATYTLTWDRAQLLEEGRMPS